MHQLHNFTDAWELIKYGHKGLWDTHNKRSYGTQGWVNGDDEIVKLFTTVKLLLMAHKINGGFSYYMILWPDCLQIFFQRLHNPTQAHIVYRVRQEKGRIIHFVFRLVFGILFQGFSGLVWYFALSPKGWLVYITGLIIFFYWGVINHPYHRRLLRLYKVAHRNLWFYWDSWRPSWIPEWVVDFFTSILEWTQLDR